MRIASLLVGFLLCSSLPALGLEAVPGTYRYRIHQQIFGDIGAHEITVRREAGALVVEHAAHLAVEILTLRAFERRSRYREVWQGDRLVAFEGLTVDDGERFEVSARAEGDRLVIETAAGRTLAPAATVPSQPSLAGAIERPTFMDIRTGRLLEARVTAAGPETLQLASGPVATEKYRIAGELEQVVWYDAARVFAQWRLWRQGAAITLTRD